LWQTEKSFMTPTAGENGEIGENGQMFESVVFKGRMLKRTYSTNSQLHSR
jgi:hypothetical protein